MDTPAAGPVREPRLRLRRVWPALLVLFLVVGVVHLELWRAVLRIPRVPEWLAGHIPAECRQLVLVLSPNQRSTSATLWKLQRESSLAPWRVEGGPVQVRIGRAGFARGEDGWESNEHHLPDKREGDGCSPAGVFRIPFAFGYAAGEPGVRLPWHQCTPTLRGVDDPASRYYNQVVDSAAVGTPDWKSSEDMLRPDDQYSLGAFIAHNEDGKPGAGSCIFLHVWKAPDVPTSGCTAMEAKEMRSLLEWLDPEQAPYLAAGVNDGW